MELNIPSNEIGDQKNSLFPVKKETIDPHNYTWLIENLPNNEFFYKRAIKLINQASQEITQTAISKLLSLLEEMEKLAQHNTHIYYQLNLILDKLIEIISDIQNEEITTYIEPTDKFPKQPFLNIIKNLEYFSQKKSTANYQINILIQAKYRNIWQTCQSGISNELGTVSEIAGGASQATRFLYTHLTEMYELIQKTGYCQTPILANPIFQQSQNIIAQYDKNDQIKHFFQILERSENNSINKYLATHAFTIPELEEYLTTTPKESEFFISISDLKNQSPYYTEPPTEYTLLKLITKYTKTLPQEQVLDIKPAYFKKLPPLVLAQMIHHNIKVLKNNIPNFKSLLIPLSEADLLKLFFPEGATKQDLYYFHQLNNLSIRQYIKDEFNIDISNYDLWIQRLFINYLQQGDSQELLALRDFLQGQTDRLIALTATYTDPSFAKSLFKISQDPESSEIFKLYNQIIKSADQVARDIYKRYQASVKNGQKTSANFFKNILARGQKLLTSYLKGTKLTILKQQLTHEYKRITEMRILSGSLAPEELDQIDLSQWDSFQKILAQDINKPEYAHLKSQIISAIKDRFPLGDAQYFSKNFILRPDAILYISSYQKELFCFFATSNLAPESPFKYVDWFISPKNTAVKRSAASLVHTADKELINTPCFLVAKPFVSLHIAIKKGYIGQNISQPEDYQHCYFECRRIPDEENYYGQNITPELAQRLVANCLHPHQLYTAPNNPTLQFCLVEFSGLTANDHVYPEHPQGKFFEIMRNMSKQNYVLSGYELISWNKYTQKYLAIFEPNKLNNNWQNKLNQDIRRLHAST